MTIDRNIYGTIETNGLVDGQAYHSQFDRSKSVPWDTPGLTITRLRLLSDPGFPLWDVSYCHGMLDGEPVVVVLPFSQLPKRGMKRALYGEAKKTGRFIKGLFDAISTLN
jgi:hypothetical protein